MGRLGKVSTYSPRFPGSLGFAAASAASLARACALRRRRFSLSAAASLSSRDGAGLGGVLPCFSMNTGIGSRCVRHQGVAGRPWLGLREAPSKRFSCCSSVVEHSLGKGEVESSILSNSTIFSFQTLFFGFPQWFGLRRGKGGRCMFNKRPQISATNMVAVPA
jgi:hypothetical protein